jgi:hypothetical protein
MSVCNPCLETDTLPVCVTSLIVGTISSLTKDVHIYVKDITTGKVVRFEETSDGAGLVTITGLGTEPDFMPDHSYELWITLADATSIEDKEDITVPNAAETTECIALNFEYTGESYTSITITA